MEGTRTSELARRLLALRVQGPDVAQQTAHSLPVVAEIGGVQYVDHSSSTFLDSSLLAILDLGHPLTWVVDGRMAEVVKARLKEFMAEHVQATVFYGPIDQDLVEGLEAEVRSVYHTDDLRTAVFTARELAEPGGKVLFSPACPGGNGMANHAERSAAFRQAVMDL